MGKVISIRPEQIYAVGREPGFPGFLLGGERRSSVPWHKFVDSCLYALDLETLEALLVDAVQTGYQILGGTSSDRRGLRGFRVGIGAHGWMGSVDVLTADSWALDLADEDDAEALVSRTQAALRAICRRLNEEVVPFRSSAYRWLSGLYRQLCEPLEPDGVANVLPEAHALLCRKAHVGGPIMHVRTTLSPFVSLDRTRAFGSAMLERIPAGAAVGMTFGKDSLTRWRPNDLMSAFGVVEATVSVFPGPLVSLLPLLQQASRFDRARTIYPLGRFRGAWCLHELAYLELSGRGRVEQLHQGVQFQGLPVFAPLIRYLRRLDAEAGIPIKMKRLEHILYGRCALSLGLTKLGSASRLHPPRPQDLLDARMVRRVRGNVALKPYPLGGQGGGHHPLYRAIAVQSAQAEIGMVDRPDRAAWVTASNRIAISQIIDRLDSALSPERSGAFVGRIYVDGIDIEAKLSDVPVLDGVEVRQHGEGMDVFRSGAFCATLSDGSVLVEGAGLVPSGSSRGQLLAALSQAPDLDGGPLAGGRVWPILGHGSDPRTLPGQVSEPLVLDEVCETLGFGV